MFDHALPKTPREKLLKPLKLHELIAGATVWTDELWSEVSTYLLERVGTMDAISMAEQLHSDGTELPDYPHKIDFLREFHDYPPTVLLGSFDLMRVWKSW
jgi:hypothetical protein